MHADLYIYLGNVYVEFSIIDIIHLILDSSTELASPLNTIMAFGYCEMVDGIQQLRKTQENPLKWRERILTKKN
jgi:hypothetical protein